MSAFMSNMPPEDLLTDSYTMKQGEIWYKDSQGDIYRLRVTYRPGCPLEIILEQRADPNER